MEEKQKVPFYKKTWFIVLSLIIFFPVGLVLMWLFTDWSKRNKWIITAVVLLLAIIINPTDEAEELADTEEEEQVAEEESQNEESSEDTEEVADEDKEEDVENKKQEEEPIKENEVEDKEREDEKQKSNVKYQHEVIDGVDVYTDFSEIVISPNNYMSNFSIEMSDLLSEVHGNLENGVVFRNATILTDGYGEEEKSIVVNVWYSQETIDRINYDNWPRLVGEDLYNTADGVIIHYALGQNVDAENKHAGDNAPQFYRDSIGAEYEE